MNTVISASAAKRIRQLVANKLAETKAHSLPAACKRFGLADGTQEEAMTSKYRFADIRLQAVSASRVLKIAKELAAENDEFYIAEELAKLVEQTGPEVTKLTRRRLIALFETRPLATEIEELELVRSVWPIAVMQPLDEFGNATLEDRIIRHTVQNYDWTPRDLLEQLGLLTCSRARLFKFLEAVCGPEVQKSSVQEELASEINSLLLKDGYTLAVVRRMSGSPVYGVKQTPKGSPADESISAVLAAFNPTDVHARWTAAMERRATEPAGAITLARTLLEDVCKWILSETDETWKETDDLPALYRKLSKVLKLAPDDHTEAVFKQILGSCQSVVKSLGALRNKLSDAHSSGPKRARPQPRHAELAVNLTVHILAAVAEHEREMISQRTKSALAAAKARGTLLGNRTNIEVAQRNSRSVRSKASAQFVQNAIPIIKQVKASGLTSLREVAEALNARGVRSARGGGWHPTQVKRVLERANEGIAQ